MSDTIYRAYRAERNSGLPHSEIVQAGWLGQFADECLLRYDLEIAAYADAMQRRAERDSIGDCDVFGRPMREGT